MYSDVNASATINSKAHPKFTEINDDTFLRIAYKDL